MVTRRAVLSEGKVDLLTVVGSVTCHHGCMVASWNIDERARLARALGDIGPGHPTLCEGWQTQHLAAHVVLRDRTPWSRSARTTAALAEQAEDRAAFDELVVEVAAGPRWPAATSRIAETINLLELFVHTEDVVRAQPDGIATAASEVRTPAHEAALWSQYQLAARLMYRRVPAGVILVVADGPRVVARRPRRGHGSVVISGPVTELIVHGFGRGAASTVRIDGAAKDVDALSERFPSP